MAPKVPSSALPGSGSQVHGRTSVAQLFLALRPGQWTKNLLVFAGLVFGQRLLIPSDVATTVAAFGLFCLFSSAVYLLNDLRDRDADRQHPRKQHRPIASGAVSPGAAAAAAVVLAVGALAAAYRLNAQFFLVGAAYLLMQVAYTLWLKHQVIIDVLVIAFGFVLRAYAGAVVVDVPFSHWLLVLTLLLALFLGLGKRRAEFVGLAASATSHRRSLEQYSVAMLDQMLSVVMACTLLAYAFYTISPETVAKFGTDHLLLTLPLPLYGLFRYLYLIHRGDAGGNPSDLLLTDHPLQWCCLAWTVLVAMILYGPLK